MPAPTASDGVTRAFSEFAAPSVVVLLAVVFTEAFLGELAAGLIYILSVIAVTYGFCQAASNWNTKYMASFVVAGFVLVFIVPDIVSKLLNAVFGIIGAAITVVGFLLVAWLLANRLGLDELVTDW